jgi:hypothetical protein
LGDLRADLTRRDVEGNHPKKARFYGIGIPKMKFGWTLLKLKVFLVDDDGSVKEKP